MATGSGKSTVRVVNSLWIGSLEHLELLCIKSFLRHGFEFHLWTYDDVDLDLPGLRLMPASQLLDRRLLNQFHYSGSPSVAAFADLFRYRLLHDIGGIWVDMDNVCLGNWSIAQPYCFPQLSSWYHLGQERSQAGGPELDSWFLKAPKGSAVFKYCFDETFDGARNAGRPWATFGPILLNEAVRKFDLLEFASARFMPINWQYATLYAQQCAWFLFYFRAFRPISMTAHLYNEVLRKGNYRQRLAIQKGSVLFRLLQEHQV